MKNVKPIASGARNKPLGRAGRGVKKGGGALIVTPAKDAMCTKR